MTTYSLLTIFILIYPIILVTSEQRRLELGFLQEVTSTPIKLHNTIPINVDTRQMSELAYTSLSNLKGILSGANSFVSGERRSVKYRMKEVEIFEGKEILSLAAYHCTERVAKL